MATRKWCRRLLRQYADSGEEYGVAAVDDAAARHAGEAVVMLFARTARFGEREATIRWALQIGRLGATDDACLGDAIIIGRAQSTALGGRHAAKVGRAKHRRRWTAEQAAIVTALPVPAARLALARVAEH